MRLAIVALACGALSCAALPLIAQSTPRTWTADNGNGTYSNPLFYDEFSDPDLIRVGDEFYHDGDDHARDAGPAGAALARPGQLGTRELRARPARPRPRVPAGRGKEIYGQGIWAPTFRHHDGTFHIFSNVNGQTTQHFTATDPARPVDAHADEALAPRPVGAVRRRREGVGRVGLPGHAPRAARRHAHRHRPGHRARALRQGRGHGRGCALLQDRREVLHHQRLVRGAHAARRRARAIVSTARGR